MECWLSLFRVAGIVGRGSPDLGIGWSLLSEKYFLWRSSTHNRIANSFNRISKASIDWSIGHQIISIDGSHLLVFGKALTGDSILGIGSIKPILLLLLLLRRRLLIGWLLVMRIYSTGLENALSCLVSWKSRIVVIV